MSKPDYDTSLARMAGNIAAGLVSHPSRRLPITLQDAEDVAALALTIARNIVELLRPPEDGQ